METILLINHAHLSRLDLNLLVAFDALLAEGSEPTPRAVALAEPIRITLAAIQEMLLQGEGFDPAEAERTFLLGMPDSIEVVLLPRLLAHLEAEAPKIRVRVRSIDRFDVLEQL